MFLSLCVGETGNTNVFYNGRCVSIESVHGGIEPDVVIASARNPDIVARVAELRKEYEGRYVFVGIDKVSARAVVVNIISVRLRILRGVRSGQHYEWSSFSFEVFLQEARNACCSGLQLKSLMSLRISMCSFEHTAVLLGRKVTEDEKLIKLEHTMRASRNQRKTTNITKTFIL